MTMSATIEIARPAGTVFDYIANMELNPTWQGGMRECRVTSPPPLGVGSTYEQVASFLGRRIETRFVVTAFEPGRSITIESVESTFPITVTRRVEPLGDARCRASAMIEGGPGGRDAAGLAADEADRAALRSRRLRSPPRAPRRAGGPGDELREPRMRGALYCSLRQRMRRRVSRPAPATPVRPRARPRVATAATPCRRPGR